MYIFDNFQHFLTFRMHFGIFDLFCTINCFFSIGFGFCVFNPIWEHCLNAVFNLVSKKIPTITEV